MNVHHQRGPRSKSEQRLASARRFSNDEWISWRDNIFAIYDRMRAHRIPYEVAWKNASLAVLPDVYAPHIFTDSFWFAEQLPNIIGDKSLLEIGTGTGIISIACALSGARVVACDINPSAIENASLNIQRYCVDIDLKVGDVYQRIRPREKFDFIFWAHPFNNWPEPIDDPLLLTGMDYQYHNLKAYIGGASQHLNHNGRLLLGTGDSADLETIVLMAKENGYSINLLAQSKLPLVYGESAEITYLIFEFRELDKPA
jgi:methylase of polypeptide subunit release factors